MEQNMVPLFVYERQFIGDKSTLYRDVDFKNMNFTRGWSRLRIFRIIHLFRKDNHWDAVQNCLVTKAVLVRFSINDGVS